MRPIFFIALTLHLGSFLPLAAAGSPPCGTPGSGKSVLQCVLENHPDLIKARLGLKEASTELLSARQIPNPELDSRWGLLSLSGTGEAPATEVALLHTLELGGKRSARVARANALLSQSSSELLKLADQIQLNTVLILHRLRQIEEEAETLSETVATFKTQTRILRLRPALTPEQEVSLSIFRLAHEDAELKETQLTSEKESLIRTLQLWMGTKASYAKAWLPMEPTQWPELAPSQDFIAQTPDAKKARAALELAEATLAEARSEGWPDLKLGPFFERTQSSSERTGSALGLQLSFALPVFHQNTGAKASARASVERAKAASLSTQAELETEESIALMTYRRATEKLAKSRWHQESEESHRKLEELFRRGLVSIPLVIEAHRQVLELQKTSHDLEMQALSALYRLQLLRGKPLEDFL